MGFQSAKKPCYLGFIQILLDYVALYIYSLDFRHWIKPLWGKIFNEEIGTSLLWCLSSAPEQEVRHKNKA